MNFSALPPELGSFFVTSAYYNDTYDGYADLVSKNPIRDDLYVVVPLTLLYAVIFVSGVVGNVITCVVIHKNRNMHTATNYYLFSLAVSDLLLLFSGELDIVSLVVTFIHLLKI
jgi:7 transmembrane receptor (rhodopsin family)